LKVIFYWSCFSHNKDIIEEGSSKKIIFLDPDEYKVLLDKIPKNQLEQKYGGDLPNQTVFW